MIANSAKRQFNAILVYQLDRFSRNRYDSAIYKAKLRKYGIVFFRLLTIAFRQAQEILQNLVERLDPNTNLFPLRNGLLVVACL